MGIERSDLPRKRFDNMRVTMANMRHIVIHVEKFPSITIVKPDAFTAHNVHRLVVEKFVRGTKYIFAPRDNRRSVRTQ